MFKIAKHTVPISISRLYKLNSDVHNYNTRQAHHINNNNCLKSNIQCIEIRVQWTVHIHSFKGNNEFIYRTCMFQSVYIWNSILQNINIYIFPH